MIDAFCVIGMSIYRIAEHLKHTKSTVSEEIILVIALMCNI